jgi:hypothetical protein
MSLLPCRGRLAAYGYVLGTKRVEPSEEGERE